MEAYELANMDLGTASAAYRFFELHVLKPMAEAIAEMEGVYQDDTNAQLVRNAIVVRRGPTSKHVTCVCALAPAAMMLW